MPKSAQLPPLMNSLLQSSHDAILIADTKLRVCHVNPPLILLTGYLPDELVGNPIDMLRPMPPDEGMLLSEIARIALAQGHWSGTFMGENKVGDQFRLPLNVVPVEDGEAETGKFVFSFSGIQHDLTGDQPFTSHIDALTDLPNRILLMDRLQQAIARSRRNKQLVAVILMDLDHFKSINNRYGHPFGDRLLRKIANRVSQTLRAGDTVSRPNGGSTQKRPSDTVARVGGDEFVLVVSGLPHMDALENILNRILQIIAVPAEIDGREVTVTASLGITIYPFDSVKPENLIRHADQAMYQAKETGRNRYLLFDAERDRQAHSRRQMLERVRQALDNDELILHYQPKVNLRNGKVVGMEALLRWNHPEKGLIMPGEFLPQVEHDDLILAIGTWVTRRALAQITEWRTQGIELGVSVNIAARQLMRHDFVECIKRWQVDYPEVPPNALEFEILESSAIANTEHVHDVIKTCQALGINFSLDDFGTGYASLTHLKEIPTEILKIDQSFIRHMLDNSDDLALVEGIIGLASAFHREVVAEGVETAEHGVLLMRLGCDLAQGYGIAHPMPAEQVPEWLGSFRPDPLWSQWADADWHMDDLPLLVAQHDHLRWIHRIAMNLEGANLQLSPTELDNHRRCRFGAWYYGQGSHLYSHYQEFKDLEGIHRDVHELGPKIVRLVQEGRTDQAHQLMHSLLKLKDHILEKLGKLQAVVAQQAGHNG